MDPVSLSLVSVLLSIFLYAIYQAWKINQYWKEKYVPYVKPTLFFGTTLPAFLGKIAPGELHEIHYKQFPNEPFFGIYEFMRPTLMVKDIELIEKILIKDFAYFVDHGLPLDDERNPLDSNLFTMTGKRWKAVRNRLSPIFTTGKLKLMFDSMKGCGDEMIRQMDKGPTEDVDLKEILGCFAMDTIGSCVFGIDAGNLSQPDNEFHRKGKEVFDLDILTSVKFLILMHFPKLSNFLNLTFGKPHLLKYYSNIIKNAVKFRRDNGYIRNDMIQLMMQLQDKGYVEMHTKDAADDYLNIDTTAYSTEKFELTDDQITGHAVFFLMGGFDSTTSGMLFTLYELSRNPTIQEKVREEILSVVKQTGSLTYDALKEMHYLEQCIKEGMRKYSPTQMLSHECTKEYTFPNGLTIPSGLMIAIPVMALHNDPKYFSEPHVYRPERFDPDQSVPACAYLPFGNGPRMCLAMRFAMLEMKYCLANLLQNYTITLSLFTICSNEIRHAGDEMLYSKLTAELHHQHQSFNFHVSSYCLLVPVMHSKLSPLMIVKYSFFIRAFSLC